MVIEPGVLYVVATPIGNLGDISARALQVLREVNWVAAEDTRHSQGLLHHFGIRTPLLSLHDHNEQDRVPRLLEALRSGESIALIADAGTPLISDPGYPLLHAIRDEGLKAVPIPGPSSLLAALSVAGLPTDRFVFEGFPPSKPQARRQYLETLRHEPRTLIFFESSHRIQESLADMAEILGPDRPAVLARELTKQFEEIHAEPLSAIRDWLAEDPNRRRGEFVVMLHGTTTPRSASVTVEVSELLAQLLAELPVKQAVALATRITDWPRNTLYQQALAMKGKGALASDQRKEDTEI
ncbi:MAG: 16S rRNA (cytidine(1402)-2'-O)-methyltransferase [Gammaproteobacteria bacterium]|nr:16S rRNA (cytidine(1402)-2'-O)-methyltransferase [Gammaproteobacteria bacterium]MCP5423755.1 16S rRNA (cytidine(1402)-2'-O)-methyltransferase [Gammaproteobacteria bacterium]